MQVVTYKKLEATIQAAKDAAQLILSVSPKTGTKDSYIVLTR